METEFQNEAGEVVCPNSLDHADLTTAYKLHHASAEELKAHGGVCRACFLKFKKNNSATLEGKIETPVVWEKHHNPTIEDHAGSVAPGDVVQTMDFDFDALDKDTAAFFANANPDVRCESAMALALILGWIWQSGFESAQCKFAAMTAGLRPDLLDDASYEEIGSKLGCVKATIAKAARNFQKQFNIKFSRSRQDDARARMAEAARGHGWRDTRKRARGQAQPPTPL